jgi:HTH-type transcriptional regulator/antitoxin HipB
MNIETGIIISISMISVFAVAMTAFIVWLRSTVEIDLTLNDANWAELANVLQSERNRQDLSLDQAAALCGVSVSFIRDAESHPKICNVGDLVRLVGGLGLELRLTGLPRAEKQNSDAATVS